MRTMVMASPLNISLKASLLRSQSPVDLGELHHQSVEKASSECEKVNQKYAMEQQEDGCYTFLIQGRNAS